MSDIKSIDEIRSVKVHWSESVHINKVLSSNEDDDIETEIGPVELDLIIKEAGKNIGLGYDKVSLTVMLSSGNVFCNECKFYITNGIDGLLALLKT